ncbi:MAG: F0F1 ATP synthase subunit alpha [Puniceicoccales bacterium]|jgi:F-type H+-transporting ATPase subunit alpha|nr:F0F1 ATP synthase subunit alpha [Puniceicoccales bacterium]
MTRDIAAEIREEIRRFQPQTVRKNIGQIIQLADGVAFVEGLSDVMYNEIVLFPNGARGVALNLEEDRVGVMLLGDTTGIKSGDTAETSGKLLSVPVGQEFLGRVVDALGNPIDAKGKINASEYYPIERTAYGIRPRQSISQPLQTGILAIDAMIPIGRGQRELIIGDRATGKSTLAIDTILNQTLTNHQGLASGDTSFRPIYSIYVAIGQKNSSIARTIQILENAGAMEFTTLVVASASENPANQYIAPYTGCTMGEWFMEHDRDALIVYDDLSKHAIAWRQISLILKRPAGREAYPGDVFAIHSRLLERATRLIPEFGGGSLTALPIIETQAGDVSAYIPTNIISITDGQIFLDTDLFNSGTRPAISVGISVSRVGSAAQTKALKQVAGKLKLELGQYYELAAFAQFGSDLDPKTQQQLDRGARIVEILKQPASQPIAIERQILLLWSIQRGYGDDLPVNSMGEMMASLLSFFESYYLELLQVLRQRQDIDSTMEEQLHAGLKAWKQQQAHPQAA